jgi:Protein of unknown function (DUF3800)
MIVVDSRFREDDARLRRFFADLTKDGSPYSRLDRILEGLFLGPSHYSIGLQCADLICAITAAAERGNGQARGYRELGSNVSPKRCRATGRRTSCSSREGQALLLRQEWRSSATSPATSSACSRRARWRLDTHRSIPILSRPC